MLTPCDLNSLGGKNVVRYSFGRQTVCPSVMRPEVLTSNVCVETLDGTYYSLVPERIEPFYTSSRSVGTS